MSRQTVTDNHDLAESGISDELRQELVLFRELKPLLSLCLTLNHDINNPLAGVLGYAEFLLTDAEKLSESQASSLKHIQECGERIQVLIEKLSIRKVELSKRVDLESVTGELLGN